MATEQERNLEIIKSAYAAGLAGDFDTFFKDLSEDCIFYEADSLPYGGEYRGVEAIKRGTQLMFGAWDNFNFEITDYCAGGDLVTVSVRISGVGRKTGKSFSMPIIEAWRLKDGKIIEIRPFYYDTARCAEVFG